MREFQFIKENV